MATESVRRNREADPSRYSLVKMPDGSFEMMTPEEVEFVTLYREADDEGKCRVNKALAAGDLGLLPPAAAIAKMTREEVIAFVDALPEPRA